MEITKFEDGCVSKYVFVKEDACYEAVLYKYPTYQERTVLCISTQCGCPVGCRFCGTGNKFIRNLTATEIIDQVQYIFEDIGHIKVGKDAVIIDTFIKKKQIMMMSMGEGFLNYDNMQDAIRKLHDLYSDADLLVSTIAPDRKEALTDFLKLSKMIDKIGLQFSIHRSSDASRNELIPFKQKLNLQEIRDYGIQWYATTGRKVYLNYCIDGTNNTPKDVEELMKLFSPTCFAMTFSVVCSKDETMKEAGFRELDTIRKFEEHFMKVGYNTRIFNPSGQDEIGGGCGQLFFVQKWMKEYGK